MYLKVLLHWVHRKECDCFEQHSKNHCDRDRDDDTHRGGNDDDHDDDHDDNDC